MTLKISGDQFSARVAELFDSCNKLADEYIQMHYLERRSREIDLDDLNNAIHAKINTLQATVIATAEMLGCNRIAERALALPLDKGGKVRALDEISQAPVGYSPAAYYLKEIADGILNALGSDASEGSRNMLIRILANTPHYIVEDKLNPAGELEVQDAIAKRLRPTYSDLIRDPPIRKRFKSFKPDFGIPGLKTVIEYKFCDSKDKLKHLVDELYTDMKGYAGTSDWKHFIAVIYQCQAYYTSEELIAEFKLSEVDDRWMPILVHGVGQRKQRPRRSRKVS